MDDTNSNANPSGSGVTGGAAGGDTSKQRFANAIEEAKAGAAALGKEAQDRAREKFSASGGEWATQAKDKASGLASDGKSKASGAIAGLGKLVSDNAGLIDERVGARYGDYARSAAQSLQDASARLDEKSLDELAEDAKAFVRQSPGLAVGLAAVGGYLLARILRGSSD